MNAPRSYAFFGGAGTNSGEIMLFSSDPINSVYGDAAMNNSKNIIPDNNPALISNSSGKLAAMSYMTPFQGVYFGSVFYAQDLNIIKSLSNQRVFVLVKSYSIKGLPHTTNNPNPVDNFNAGAYSISLGYGFVFTKKIDLGLDLGVISEQIAKTKDYGGSNFGVQMGFGAKYRFTKKLKIGASLLNLGYESSLREKSSMLPLSLKFAAAYDVIKGLELIPSLQLLLSGLFSVGMTGQYTYKDVIFLRAGYSSYRNLGVLSNLNLGVGVKYKRYILDYALNNYGDLGLTNFIMLSVSL